MKAALTLIALCGTLVTSTAGLAQNYPSGPMRLVVPYPPGGGADILGRVLAQKLNQSWGQPVIVDNRGGANGTIGTAYVAKSPPDGHTILLGGFAFAVNPSLYPNLPFDSLRDLQPLTQLAATPQLVIVHPSLPAKSIKELIALAKARPGQINYASPGNGSPPHLATELFKHMTGVQMTNIPYKGGGPAQIAMLSGEVQLNIQSLNSAIPLVKDGRLRGLAVTSAKRHPAVPDIPTMAEAGVPGYEFENWYGLFVAAGTPRDVYMKLNAEVVRILNLPDLKARLAGQGATVVGSTPDQFKEFVKKEIAKSAQIVKVTGMKLD